MPDVAALVNPKNPQKPTQTFQEQEELEETPSGETVSVLCSFQ
jgi:hypothetical protein